MEKLPAYPNTIAQKIDVALFAGKNEKANIVILNERNQYLYDLTENKAFRQYGRPIPQGFTDRVTGSLNRLTKNHKTFDEELNSLESQIRIQEAKRKPIAPVNPITSRADERFEKTVEKQVLAIQREWLAHCKQQTVINKGTVVYSGQYSNTDIAFDQLSNFEKLNQGMWLTQELDEAMRYATRCDDDGTTVHGRQIFCFAVQQDITVLEFDKKHHPAQLHPDNKETLAYGQVVTSRFDDVVSPLIHAGKATKQAIGHLRYSDTYPDAISELWVKKPDPKLLQVKDIFTLSLLKKNTHNIYPDMAERNNGTAFALSRLKQFSSINDFEAWLALSHMAKTQPIDETHTLETLAEECGFTQLTNHIKEAIKGSTNERLTKLLNEHERLLEIKPLTPPTLQKEEVSPEQTRKPNL